MGKFLRLETLVAALGVFAVLGLSPLIAKADTAAEIDREVDIAIEKLFARYPAARALATEAEAMLVFPTIIKGGFVVGALRRGCP